jgi:hypothetical protein
MAVISAIVAAMATWHWSMIAAFLAGASFLVAGHSQILRPWLRRRKLRQPFRAYFLVTSLGRLPTLDYVLQDDEEHFVKELVVPPNSEIQIQIVLEPTVSFLQRELYFGCDEYSADKNKPHAIEYFVPFVAKGVRGQGKPDAAHPGHYIDYNGFYHVREDYLYTKDTRVIGFKLVTGVTGTYPAQIYTQTDDVRGRADLIIKVERPAKTKMRCFMTGHRSKGCFVTPLGKPDAADRPANHQTPTALS